MLFAEGASDGGAAGFGEPALLYIPLIVSTIVVAVSLATYVLNVRKGARDHVWAYLQLLTSKDTAQTRSVVAEAARVARPLAAATVLRLQVRTSQGGRERTEERQMVSRYRDAAFQMMWIVALAPSALPRRNAIERWIVGDTIRAEQSQVYWHLTVVVDELSEALELWGDAFSWGESGRRVDDALDALPEDVPYINGKRIERPSKRLRLRPKEVR